jgi:hypothetical protein
MSSLGKIKDVAVGTVRGAVKDPGGTAGRALDQAKGTLAFGKSMAEQFVKTAAGKATGRSEPGPAASLKTEAAPKPATPTTPAGPEPEVTPSDVARVVEKKSPAEKAAARTSAAKKAPAKTAASTPGAKLPAKKTAAKKTAAKKTAAKRTAPEKTATEQPPAPGPPAQD